jgi:molecular chaperone DnaK
LSEEEIKTMTKDAELHGEEDKKRKELVEAQNQADSLIYSVEKSLKEHGSKLPASEMQSIEQALEKCRKAKGSAVASEIKKAIEELSSASHKLAEYIYKDAGAHAAGAGPQQKAKQKEDEDVVEAEFEEVDKDKK